VPAPILKGVFTMSKRAIRRHHATRLKRKRSTYSTVKDFYTCLETDKEDYEKRRAKAVDTPTPCSCFMCGNPRRHFEEKTIQEKKFDLENLIDYE